MYIDRLLIIDSGLKYIDGFIECVQHDNVSMQKTNFRNGVSIRKVDFTNKQEWANMLSNLEGKRYSYVGLVSTTVRLTASTMFLDNDLMVSFARIFPTRDEMLLPYIGPCALDVFAWNMDRYDNSLSFLRGMSTQLSGVPIHYATTYDWSTSVDWCLDGLMLDEQRAELSKDAPTPSRNVSDLYLQPGSVDNYKFDFYK
jgi:hypothetical protein